MFKHSWNFHHWPISHFYIHFVMSGFLVYHGYQLENCFQICSHIIVSWTIIYALLTLHLLNNRTLKWIAPPFLSLSDTPSLHSYWENRYHHLDTPGTSADPHATLYSSAARLGASSVSQLQSRPNNGEERSCDISAGHVLQAHSFHSHDIFQVRLT